MGRGYEIEEIREKLISKYLKDSDSGMSGIEISEKLNVNRITMTKYLKVFAAEGFTSTKKYWKCYFMVFRTGQESFIFPDDYFKVTSQYLGLFS